MKTQRQEGTARQDGAQNRASRNAQAFAVAIPPLEERTVGEFWKRVEKTTTCWLWVGHRDAAGYGRFWCRESGGRQLRAHRVAYELVVGPIPDGLTIDHICRVRHCVNPTHMEPVTIGENVLRGTAPPVMNAAQTHCAHGHELSGANLHMEPAPNGRLRRRCRACNRTRATRRARKAAGHV